MALTQDIPTHDLPHWMRQAQHRWDWGLLLALILGLIAAWPFLLQTGLTRTNATENHVFMTDDYSNALREGRLYPRWSPNVINGYGAPVAHYYPPAAPYSAALVQLLFTNNAVNAVRVLYILSFCLASVGTYLLVRRHISPQAGILAAILYCFSPYISQTAPHALGDLPGLFALGCIPVALWSVDRLLTDNRPLDVLGVAVMTSLLILTHVQIALAALFLAIALIGYHVFVNRHFASGVMAFGSIIMGVCLAAFFWMPALLENDLVQWQKRASSMVPTLNLGGLLKPFQPIDPNEMVLRPQFTLGLPLIGFTILGLISALLTRQKAGFGLYFLFVGMGLSGAAILLFPTHTWLVGVISSCLAFSAGNIFTITQKIPARTHEILPAVLIIFLFAVSQPTWLAPHWNPAFGEVSPAQQIAYEQQGAGIAILSAEAPLPVTIDTQLQPNRFLLSGYTTGNLNKVAPIVSSPRSLINLLEHTAHSDRLQVQFDVSTRLDILTAYFPGWSAFAGNRPLPLAKNPATGLMLVEVPAMSGEISIGLGTTPIRQSAWFVAGLALVCLLLITILRFQRDTPIYIPEVSLLPIAQMRLMGVSVLCFIGVILLGATSNSPFNLQARPGYGLDNAVSLLNITQAGLEAVAFRINSLFFRPGDTLDIDLYWETIRTLSQNYQVQIYLRDIDRGTRWHRTELETPGNYPTSRWRQYAYIRDHHAINLSNDILSGIYEITIEVYDCGVTCRPEDRLTFFDNNGRLLGQALVLPQTIRIQR